MSKPKQLYRGYFPLTVSLIKHKIAFDDRLKKHPGAYRRKGVTRQEKTAIKNSIRSFTGGEYAGAARRRSAQRAL